MTPRAIVQPVETVVTAGLQRSLASGRFRRHDAFMTGVYWRIASFPELEHLSPEDRDHLVNRCFGWRAWAALLFRCVMAGLICAVLVEVLVQQRGNSFAATVLALLSCTVAGLAKYQFELLQVRGALRTYLKQASRKTPLSFCLSCGYSLTGLESDRCPECGQSR